MSCLQMHFLADHAIESCHQSLAASQFRLLGVEGRLGRGEAGQARKKKVQRLCVCARVRGGGRQGRARSGPGSSPGFASLRRGEAALSLLASGSLACGSVGRPQGPKQREPERWPHPSAAGGPAQLPPRASQPWGHEPAPRSPVAAWASFCLASAFHTLSPHPPRPSPWA